MDVRQLFQAELEARDMPFSIDEESGCHVLVLNGMKVLASLENLERDFASDPDPSRISKYVDTLLGIDVGNIEITADRLFWSLEPNDFHTPPPIRTPVGRSSDRVLVYLSPSAHAIVWVDPRMLEEIGLSEEDASQRAFDNLDIALTEARLQILDAEGVPVGALESSLPFKSSLILAPALRTFVEASLGWPLLGIAPDRDFLYVWGAHHNEFVQRVGGVVVQEFAQAPYPISTEVFAIGDAGVKAIGEFPHSS